MDIDSDGLEVLDRAECLRLLDSAAVGRIAGTSGALPVVLPVSYVLNGESIVIETGRGTTLDFVTSGSVVAFVVDNRHDGIRRCWTVMVTGVAEEVAGDLEIQRLRRLLPRDHDGHDQRFVRIPLELVSGRQTSPEAAEIPSRV